jgi:hypothetical protein
MELDDDRFESMARDLKIAITRIIDSGLRDPVEIAAEYMKYLEGPHHDPHRVAAARGLIEQYARYRLGLPETKH